MTGPTDTFALPFGIGIDGNLVHALFRFVFAHMVSNEVPVGLLTGVGFVVLIRPFVVVAGPSLFRSYAILVFGVAVGLPNRRFRPLGPISIIPIFMAYIAIRKPAGAFWQQVGNHPGRLRPIVPPWDATARERHVAQPSRSTRPTASPLLAPADISTIQTCAAADTRAGSVRSLRGVRRHSRARRVLVGAAASRRASANFFWRDWDVSASIWRPRAHSFHTAHPRW